MFDWFKKWWIRRAYKWEYAMKEQQFSKIVNAGKTSQVFIRWKRDGWLSVSIYQGKNKLECKSHIIINKHGVLHHVS